MKTLIFAFRNYVNAPKRYLIILAFLRPRVKAKYIFFNLESDSFLSHNQQLIINKSFNSSIVDRVIGPNECTIMETKKKYQSTQKF